MSQQASTRVFVRDELDQDDDVEEDPDCNVDMDDLLDDSDKDEDEDEDDDEGEDEDEDGVEDEDEDGDGDGDGGGGGGGGGDGDGDGGEDGGEDKVEDGNEDGLGEEQVEEVEKGNASILPQKRTPQPNGQAAVLPLFEVDDLDASDDDPSYEFSEDSEDEESETSSDESSDHPTRSITDELVGVMSAQLPAQLPTQPQAQPRVQPQTPAAQVQPKLQAQVQVNVQPIQKRGPEPPTREQWHEQPREQPQVQQQQQQQLQQQHVHSTASGTSPQPRAPTRRGGEDDDEDPDYQVTVNEAELDEVDLDTSAARNEEYTDFLLSLFNGVEDAAALDLPIHPTQQTGDALASATTPDDDADFDYLRESVNFRDDPLEYRNDLNVPREEVLHLLSQKDGGISRLRPQTRHSRHRKRARAVLPTTLLPTAMPAPIGQPVVRKPTPVLPLLLPPQPPAPPPPTQSWPASVAPSLPVDAMSLPSLHPVPAPRRLETVSSSTAPAVPAPQSAAPHAASHMLAPLMFSEMSAPHLARFRDQLSAHVQIATHVHAELARRLRFPTGRASAEPSSPPPILPDVSDALARSEKMLRRLSDAKMLATRYDALLHDRLSALAAQQERALRRDVHKPALFSMRRQSAFDHVAIDGIPVFLAEVAAAGWDGTMRSTAAIAALQNADIDGRLRRRVVTRKPTADRSRHDWPPWTPEDDTLLAMTIAKYGREFGELCSDLLPHRCEEDCQLRVRYLSSRRCADNAVKRQVMTVNTPLNREELRIVQEGLQRFGPSDDPQTWKRIQRELLPGREWSHLQKLWEWRETRRKYKAKYRARAKRARLETAVE